MLKLALSCNRDIRDREARRVGVSIMVGVLVRVKILLFANTEWYLYNFRLALARALRAAGAEVVLLSPDGPYGARLRAEGFRWIALPMKRRSLNPIRELQLLWRLVRLYRREQPAVVHHFTIKCVVYGSLSARIAGVSRRINAVTGMGYVFANEEQRARALRPFVRWLMKLALGGKQTCLILQNSDDFDAFQCAGLVDKERVRLIRGSGVDTTRFRPHFGLARDQRPFRLLFAARLLWDKGIKEYVEAARLMKADGLNIEFWVAGSPDPGNPSSVPAETVRNWADAGLIRPLGHVEDMAHWLSQVDAAVLPSYREGAPKSLIEAAACGLPVISTDTPGCREVVEHNVNGLLVPPRDAKALAAAIRSIYHRPDERRRMGAAGREKILREYDEKLVLAKTLDVYRELVPAGFLEVEESQSAS